MEVNLFSPIQVLSSGGEGWKVVPCSKLATTEEGDKADDGDSPSYPVQMCFQTSNYSCYKVQP